MHIDYACVWIPHCLSHIGSPKNTLTTQGDPKTPVSKASISKALINYEEHPHVNHRFTLSTHRLLAVLKLLLDHNTSAVHGEAQKPLRAKRVGARPLSNYKDQAKRKSIDSLHHSPIRSHGATVLLHFYTRFLTVPQTSCVSETVLHRRCAPCLQTSVQEPFAPSSTQRRLSGEWSPCRLGATTLMKRNLEWTQFSLEEDSCFFPRGWLHPSYWRLRFDTKCFE